MLPATGSTITAAMSAFSSKSRASASTSLYGATSVSATAPGVTPGESGSPSVATPDPAWTRRRSAWPW